MTTIHRDEGQGDTLPLSSARVSISKLPLSSLRLSGVKKIPGLLDSPTSSASTPHSDRSASPDVGVVAEGRGGWEERKTLSVSPNRLNLLCQKCGLDIHWVLQKTHAALCEPVYAALITGRHQHEADPPSKQHSRSCETLVGVLLSQVPLLESVAPQTASASSPRLAEIVFASARLVMSIFRSLNSVTFEKIFTGAVSASLMPGTLAYNVLFSFSVDRARELAKLHHNPRNGNLTSDGVVIGQCDAKEFGAHGYDPQSALDAWRCVARLRTVTASRLLPPLLTERNLAAALAVGNLRHLIIDNCPALRELPEAVSLLKRLVTFQCSNCALAEVPCEALREMQFLESLDVSGNGIGPGRLPRETLVALRKLQTLEISGNKFWRPRGGKKMQAHLEEHFSWLITEMLNLRILFMKNAFSETSRKEKSAKKWEKTLQDHLKSLEKKEQTRINLILVW